MSTERIISEIEQFALPVVEELGLELVEIEFRRESGGWILRLFIDREGGVNVDDCASVSRDVSAYLEVEEIINHAYKLEVSSPGLERPLKKDEDFIRFTGRKARIKLKDPVDGQRVFIGQLEAVLESGGEDKKSLKNILLTVDGQQMEIDLESIARARLSL